jgi:hypothetical protein
MQFSKECLKSAVEHCTANLQQLMRALRRPAHRLALTHSPIYQTCVCNLTNSWQRISALRRLGHQLLKDWTRNDDIDSEVGPQEVVGDVERLARGMQDGKVGGDAVDIYSGKRNHL